MPAKTIFIRLRAAPVFLIAAVALSLTSAWASDHETVLHTFGNFPDGSGAGDGLVMDAAGNLYGTTFQGGGTHCTVGCGTVFELSPGQAGWTETILYNFEAENDGNTPNGTLIMDAAGNLYGVTDFGGMYNRGTVFELTRSQGGGWTETILHSFGSGTDGDFPGGALLREATGDLYGTTNSGGTYGWGTVFEVSPNSGGVSTETVLYNFGNGHDGIGPNGGLIRDATGNLYGTTYNGGQGGGFCQGSGCGTVFELSPSGGGWTETVLHSFNSSDGYGPEAGVVMDAAGNLYGTAVQGGNFGSGTVFELSPVMGGGWTETTLHNFSGQADGAEPESSLILDPAGNLYGTTFFGGNDNSGTVFKMSPRQGSWTETMLYSFTHNSNGGEGPASELIMDRAGDLYGVTLLGGTYFGGVAYELTPPFICAVRCRSAEQ